RTFCCGGGKKRLMLVTLLAWLYISFVSFSWGAIFLYVVKSEREAPGQFFTRCLAGLAVVGILLGWLSLFMALGHPMIQLVLFIPPLIFWIVLPGQRRSAVSQVAALFGGMKWYAVVLMSLTLVLILVMSTWYISHPDTLGYHAQTIRWIEEYPAVPGLVHLSPRMGYQGLWYVVCAGFSFPFVHAEALTYVNTAVLFWLVLFFGRKISDTSSQQASAILWTFLLAFALWDYNYIRLTASSASNDFVTGIYVWAAVYLFAGSTRSAQDLLLILLFSVFAITLKLSVFPILLLAAMAVFLQGRSQAKWLWVSVLLIVVVMVPFLARNVITSGYLLYPSPFPDLFAVDWKLDHASTVLEKQYISAWARIPGTDHAHAVAVLDMPPGEWVPHWWALRTLPEKFLLILTSLMLVVTLVRYRLIRSAPQRHQFTLLILLTGIVSWWMLAPDPRFSIGFTIPFLAILLLLNFPVSGITVPKTVLPILCVILAAAIAGYSAYRVKNYFEWKHLVTPSGTRQQLYETMNCRGIIMTVPLVNDCGDQPVPCLKGDCGSIQPRGAVAQDGFRSSWKK
ncbi:MAG TPA: hypothetical protein VFZ78_04430, partial [Flavisolibacter sp.]